MSSCCTPEGSCHTDQAADGATAVPATATVGDGHTTVYKVGGVNSAHCQGVVTKALTGLDSVIGVEVGIGTGLVTVVTGGEADDALIAETIDEFGYDFAGRA
ncbi:heavy-metal-associated domain-containing protein [Streptomyces sp. NPDC050433]|uniref:heavy-metal-associated domain-containing protein n=1 Tax=unclassified Streptomyces TaxID=2593676 RepID=UPI00341995C6